MKLVSWNVNGLRACLGKGFLDYCAQEDADVVCLQETKLQPEQAVFDLDGYHRYFYSAEKKGYSGTAVLTKHRAAVRPLRTRATTRTTTRAASSRRNIRTFYLVCCYTPNSQDGLKRLDYRMQWEDALRAYLLRLDAEKPVVYCGDLNVAHEEIDIKNPKTEPPATPASPTRSARKMTELLASGFADTFRRLHPDTGGRILVVELPLPRAGKERGLAHRLFYRLRAAAAARRLGLDPRGRAAAATTARWCWSWTYDAGGIYRPATWRTSAQQQKAAVQAVNGAVLLLAVPGSGKTTVLVTRLGYLALCCGVDPGSILVMTYTVAATQELRARFAALFPQLSGRTPQFRTINGLSAKIIEACSRQRGPAFALQENAGELAALVGRIYQELNGEYPTDSDRPRDPHRDHLLQKHDAGCRRDPRPAL